MPGEHVLIDAVDERTVEIEDKSRPASFHIRLHSRPARSSGLCHTMAARSRLESAGRRRARMMRPDGPAAFLCPPRGTEECGDRPQGVVSRMPLTCAATARPSFSCSFALK